MYDKTYTFIKDLSIKITIQAMSFEQAYKKLVEITKNPADFINTNVDKT